MEQSLPLTTWRPRLPLRLLIVTAFNLLCALVITYLLHRGGSFLGTVADPDGNWVQIIRLSDEVETGVNLATTESIGEQSVTGGCLAITAFEGSAATASVNSSAARSHCCAASYSRPRL